MIIVIIIVILIVMIIIAVVAQIMMIMIMIIIITTITIKLLITRIVGPRRPGATAWPSWPTSARRPLILYHSNHMV